jgi:hypothetical protein
MRNGSSRSPPEALPFSVPPYLLSTDEVANILGTNIDTGLDDGQVASLQQKYGPNAVWPLFLFSILGLIYML